MGDRESSRVQPLSDNQSNFPDLSRQPGSSDKQLPVTDSQPPPSIKPIGNPSTTHSPIVDSPNQNSLDNPSSSSGNLLSSRLEIGKQHLPLTSKISTTTRTIGKNPPILSKFPPLILASGSATRARLLREVGIPFCQIPVQFDEEGIDNGLDGYRFVMEASYGKFQVARSLFPGYNIITADTVVTDGLLLFRKPKNREEAKKLLLKQSGRQIKIVTGMWIQIQGQVFGVVDETIYQFAPFNPMDLEQFLKKGEWQGKAGGCMVEGFCKKYIRQVRGYQSTAMGLPIELLVSILKRVGFG